MREAALLALLSVAGVSPAEAAPACIAESRLEPTSAVVGQQVLYAVRILRSEDVDHVSWLEPPAFPGFRSEWLPAQLSREPEARGRERYLVVEERRALFPVRVGNLEIPPARLHCPRSDARAAGREPEIASVPGARLEVRALPNAGRPEGFRGVVGSLELSAHVEPRTVALGDTVRVSVLVRGDANLWDLGDPLPGAEDMTDAELFRRRPDLALTPGARLLVRNSFAYDVVPRRVGELRIPGARVAYFDAERGTYATANTRPVVVRVEPRGARDDARAAALSRPQHSAAGDPSSARWARLAVLALASVGVVAAALALRSARRRANRRWGGVASALRAAAAARDRHDPAAEARAFSEALRAALLPRFAGARALDAEELLGLAAGDPPAEAAARLLLELDRARFDPAGRAPNANAVTGALQRLRSWTGLARCAWRRRGCRIRALP